jgi:hypothetical protein
MHSRWMTLYTDRVMVSLKALPGSFRLQLHLLSSFPLQLYAMV